MQTNEIILSMFNIVALTVFLQEIDESHLCSTFKYIKNKPVKELKGDQFLRMCKAEEDGLLTINIEIDLDKNAGYPTNYFDWQSGFLYLSFSRSSCFFCNFRYQTYFDEVKQLYYRVSLLVCLFFYLEHLSAPPWGIWVLHGDSEIFLPYQEIYPFKRLILQLFFDSQLKLRIIVTIHPGLFDNCINRIRRKLKTKTTRIKSIECPFVTKIKRERELDLILPSHSQDLISNSPYCLPYNSYYVSSESLVLDQLTKGREQVKVLIVCSSHIIAAWSVSILSCMTVSCWLMFCCVLARLWWTGFIMKQHV